MDHVPLPEPIFAETVTDIDSRTPGEFEFELNASDWRAARGGVRELGWGAEAEAILLPRIGVRAELFSLLSTGSPHIYGFSAAASAKLVDDVRHDFYLQAEVGGRYASDVSTYVEPGESALPATLDLRLGYRRGPLTLRASLGVEAFGAVAYAPVRADLSVLAPFGPVQCGFFGVEVLADFARASPFTVALDIVPNLTSLRLPFKLGLALPWGIGAAGSEPALGIFVRLFIESEREIEYGAKHAQLR